MLVIGILITIAGIVESLVAGRQLAQRSFGLPVGVSEQEHAVASHELLRLPPSPEFR